MLYTKAKSFSALRAFPVLAVIFSLLLFGLLACAAAQESPLETAEAELKSGKYQAAITSFTRLLQSSPNEAHAQRGLLQAYLETGQYEAAERDAKRFLNSKNNEAQTRLMLGEVYAVTGRYNEASAEFEKAGKAEAAPIKLRANLRRAELLLVKAGEDFSFV